MPKIRLKI